jgi:hypothetical protein
MSKRTARRRKKASIKQQKTDRRKLLMTVCLPLCLLLAGITAARWPTLPVMIKPASQASPGHFNANNPAKEYIYAGGRLIATEEPASATAPPAPTAFLATAQPTQSTSTVNLTWTAPAGSFEYYKVEITLHKSDPQWTTISTNLANTSTSYDHTTAATNTAYLYRICAVTGSLSTCTSPDLATTTYFHDYPFQANQTAIRAQHFLDLMSAVNAVRTLADLPNLTWSGSYPAPVAGGTIHKSHLNDLREGLRQALLELGYPEPQYEAPAPILYGTQVRASQLRQLQDLVR